MRNLFCKLTVLFVFIAMLLGSACQATTPPTNALRAQYKSVSLNDGAWAPDAQMISALETHLPAYLSQNQNKFNATKPSIVERLAQYKFQYWGEIQNNKRIIIVNAFCANFDDWKTQRVFVLDGGDCFFNLKYDIDAGTFFDLQVNGEA